LKKRLLLLWLCSGFLFANVEPPLPEWNTEDRASMLDDGWMAGGSLLTYESLPEEDQAEDTPLAIDEPTQEELAELETEENIVGEEYLTGYFEEKPELYLVDPQSLLGTKEKQDLQSFLDYHASDSSIDMYIYVFGGDQQIPGDVREEEVVERLYSVGKPAVVAYYYLGAPQRSEIYLSPIITDAVSAAEQRRALKSSVVQAFSSVNLADQLEAFLVQMSIRIYWMERMTEGTAAATKEAIPDGEEARAFHERMEKEEETAALPSWIGLVGGVFVSLCGGLLLVWSSLMWWKHRSRFLFPEFEVEPRMGGSHAAGIGAVISFSSTAVPPARQRDQVPDYMRRA
jgi:hypothetical protein|tara:strand:+ start:19293 stop:20321 length:1029 start_codon:yes stop_codon:yes gene_type:complete